MKNQFRVLILLIFALSFGFTACNGTAGVDANGGNLLFPPSAPGAATVTAAESQLSLSWSGISDATYYEVWYNTVNNSATSTQSGGNISTTSYTIPGLTNGTLYYVWLKAKNTVGSSSFGSVASGTPVLPLSPPNAPGMASITAGNTQLSLSWSAVSGATYYTVWYNTADDSSTATQKGGDISSRNYTITGLSNGTLYYVWIKAKNSAGTSGFGTVASGTPNIFAPSVYTVSVTNLKGSSATCGGNVYSTGGATVTARGICWSTNPNPTISNSKTSNGTGTGAFTGTLSGMNLNTTYYVRAYATNSVGTEYGNEVTITTNSVYAIGDFGPAGGYIFYNKGSFSDGWQYLEAAPTNQASSKWGADANYNFAEGTAVGTGKSNTQKIIDNDPLDNTAADVCVNLTIGGYNDWFLPSRDELSWMNINLKQSGKVNFPMDFYWSSSEIGSGIAWIQYFGPSSTQGNGGKSYTWSVRAARAF